MQRAREAEDATAAEDDLDCDEPPGLVAACTPNLPAVEGSKGGSQQRTFSFNTSCTLVDGLQPLLMLESQT